MKSTVQAIWNKKVGSLKAPEIFIVPQQIENVTLKIRAKKMQEVVNTNLGKKLLLPKKSETDLSETAFLWRKYFRFVSKRRWALAFELVKQNKLDPLRYFFQSGVTPFAPVSKVKFSFLICASSQIN